MKAKYLLMVFLVGIFALPLISSTKKDPCQAVDDVKISRKLAEKAKKIQKPTNIDNIYFKNTTGEKIAIVEEGCECYAGKYDMIYIFNKNYLPPELTEFYASVYLDKPSKEINKKIKNAMVIEDTYFITKKGIQLGMSIDEVIAVYGAPDKRTVLKKHPNIIVKYDWEMPGQIELANSEPPAISAKTEPIAEQKKENSTKKSQDEQNTKASTETIPEPKNENANKPHNDDIMNANLKAAVEQSMKNSNKSQVDRIIEGPHRSNNDIYSITPTPYQPPPKKYPKGKICKDLEVGLTIEITFIDGKVVFIDIGYWGV